MAHKIQNFRDVRDRLILGLEKENALQNQVIETQKAQMEAMRQVIDNQEKMLAGYQKILSEIRADLEKHEKKQQSRDTGA